MSSTSGMIVYLVFIIAILYFMAIRPQSKEKKKQAEPISPACLYSFMRKENVVRN